MEEKWWKQSQSGINFSRKSKSVEHNYPLKRATRGKNFKIILNLGIKGNWRCPECLIHCCCCYCCCCYFYHESMGKISSAFSARHNGKESSCLMLPMPTEYRNRPSYFRTTVILYIYSVRRVLECMVSSSVFATIAIAIEFMFVPLENSLTLTLSLST